jgi:hypothetical protein
MAIKKTVRRNYNLPKQQVIDAGCYIDFEGFAGNEFQASPAPILIGIFHNGSFKQVVFTQEYRWAALDPGVEHPVEFEEDRAQYLKDLVTKVSMNKPFFAYSEYEKTVIQHQVGHQITKRYRDVRGIAKRRFKKYPNIYPAPAKKRENSLVEVAQFLEIPMAEKLAKGGVTKRLRSIRDYSKSRKGWAAAPAKVRREWREVLEHNRLDVLCMVEILNTLRARETAARQ